MGIRETYVIKDVLVPEQLPVAGLYGVEQVLNWRTAPIKRIDALVMGDRAAFSARTSNLALVGPRWIVSAAPATPAAEQQPSPGGGRSGRLEGGEGAGGRAGSGGSETTLNGFKIKRYIDTNDQVRHVPVAMALIVQEENIPDVLAAFANSKLRIAVNQFHWQHSHDSIMPRVIETVPGAPTPQPVAQRPGRGGGGRFSEREGVPGRTGGGQVAAPSTGAGRRGGGGRFGGEGGEAPGGGRPGQGPQMAAGGQQPSFLGGTHPSSGSGAPEQEEDMNLMNMSVYGIAALYEKYPPKAGSGAGAAVN
jgi:hypothetical protein